MLLRLVQSLKALAPMLMTVSGITTSVSASQFLKQLALTFRMFLGSVAFTRLLAPVNSDAGSVLFSVFMPALPSVMTASLRSMLVTKRSSVTFLLVRVRVTICCSSFRSTPFSGPVTFSSATLKRTLSGSCADSVPTESTLTFIVWPMLSSGSTAPINDTKIFFIIYTSFLSF